MNGENVEGNLRESVGQRFPVETPSSAPPSQDPRSVGVAATGKAIRLIEIERIVPDPDQPRKEFDPDALASLARSIARDGVITPINVRWDDQILKYKIIAGERRWRASLAAGMTKLNCVVSEGLDDRAVTRRQLVENCLKEDLNAIELAEAIRDLMRAYDLNQEQAAAEAGLSPGHVSRVLKLLTLDKETQLRIVNKEISKEQGYRIAVEASRGDSPKAVDKSRTTKKSATHEVDGITIRGTFTADVPFADDSVFVAFCEKFIRQSKVKKNQSDAKLKEAG